MFKLDNELRIKGVQYSLYVSLQCWLAEHGFSFISPNLKNCMFNQMNFKLVKSELILAWYNPNTFPNSSHKSSLSLVIPLTYTFVYKKTVIRLSLNFHNFSQN